MFAILVFIYLIDEGSVQRIDGYNVFYFTPKIT